MTTIDILLVVDCESYNVKMYSDPKYVKSGLGEEELTIKAKVGDVLRWHAVPFQVSSGNSDRDFFHVLITKVELYDNTNSSVTADANNFLTGWTVNDGLVLNPSYNVQTNSGDIIFNKDNGNAQISKEIPLQKKEIYTPYVQCNVSTNTRDLKNVTVAYTFWASVFKDGILVKEFHWDPYVVITP